MSKIKYRKIHLLLDYMEESGGEWVGEIFTYSHKKSLLEITNEIRTNLSMEEKINAEETFDEEDLS